jgi:hypothetical protein
VVAPVRYTLGARRKVEVVAKISEQTPKREKTKMSMRTRFMKKLLGYHLLTDTD